MHEIYLGCRCNGSDRTLSPVHHRWIFHWKRRSARTGMRFSFFRCTYWSSTTFSPKVDGVKLSCIQFLTCGVLSGIPALLLEHPELSSILASWQPILYAGVMSCGVAYTLQIIGQKNMNPTVASLILSLESCISVLAGWIILRQQLSTKEILGCVIMFAAIILAQLPQKQTE